MNSELWALAGFMGFPSDWDIFGLKNLKAIPIDLFDWNTLSDWTSKFSALVSSRSVDKSVLIGYSLGGRLALHALIQKTSIWKAGIIISAHPGLSSHEEGLERYKLDEQWAIRFEKEEWGSLMDDWNARTVFGGGNFNFQRNEKDYYRQKLANILRRGSLGLQNNLRFELSNLNVPLLWIVGANDEIYKNLVSSVNLKHPLSRKIIIPNSGHRVPWEQPDNFVQQVQEFLACL